MSVPDLAHLAAQAAQAQQDPWANVVTINQPDGRQQQMPLPIGVFVMLGDISANLAGIRQALDQLALAIQVKE